MSKGENLPVEANFARTSLIKPSLGNVIGASGMTGQTFMLHVPQKTKAASTAKNAVKAKKEPILKRLFNFI